MQKKTPEQLVKVLNTIIPEVDFEVGKKRVSLALLQKSSGIDLIKWDASKKATVIIYKNILQLSTVDTDWMSNFSSLVERTLRSPKAVAGATWSGLSKRYTKTGSTKSSVASQITNKIMSDKLTELMRQLDDTTGVDKDMAELQKFMRKNNDNVVIFPHEMAKRTKIHQEILKNKIEYVTAGWESGRVVGAAKLSDLHSFMSKSTDAVEDEITWRIGVVKSDSARLNEIGLTKVDRYYLVTCISGTKVNY